MSQPWFPFLIITLRLDKLDKWTPMTSCVLTDSTAVREVIRLFDLFTLVYQNFCLILRAKLVKRAGGLYSGVCNYCNSYDNKIFIFMFIVYCYFFPSEWSAAVFMKDVFDDSIHLFISAFIILYHHFFMFPYLHITVSNDFSYLSFKNDKYFKIIYNQTPLSPRSVSEVYEKPTKGAYIVFLKGFYYLFSLFQLSENTKKCHV